jgi:putative FmdB family regulatory protein
MPIYEYHCKSCQCTFESIVWSTANAEQVECPGCGGRDTERLLSCFAVGNRPASSAGASCSTAGKGFS